MKRDRSSNYAGVLLGLALAGLLAFVIDACGGALGGVNPQAPGNTSSVPPETSFWVLGTPGLPFSAVISDSTASWKFRGVVPESVVIVNNAPPAQMTVTKLTNDRTVLSTEIIRGVSMLGIASSMAPFGTATVTLVGGVQIAPPPANPDIRFFVKSPNTGLFTGLIEDQNVGFVIEARIPSLILFERPSGTVDAVLNQIGPGGPFVVDILSNGQVVREAVGGVNVNVSFP